MMRKPFVMRNSQMRCSGSEEEESALIEDLPSGVAVQPNFVSLDGGTRISKARGETTDDE